VSGKGFLLAMMEPPAGFDEEFHDWYDTEHVPERMAVAGFETGQRFVCLSGFPKYAACYDLSSPDVLDSPGYLRLRGKGISPWGLRVRARTYGRYRFTGVQVHPGQSLLGQQGAPARLAILRFRQTTAAAEGLIREGLHKNFGSRPDVRQMRLFRGEGDEGEDCLATVEFGSAAASVDADPAAFGAAARRLDCINLYAPYWRSAYSP
jgi:hypothetical protein